MFYRDTNLQTRAPANRCELPAWRKRCPRSSNRAVSLLIAYTSRHELAHKNGDSAFHPHLFCSGSTSSKRKAVAKQKRKEV